MVKVLYYRISEELEPAIFNHYLQKLPVEFQEKALRCKSVGKINTPIYSESYFWFMA